MKYKREEPHKVFPFSSHIIKLKEFYKISKINLIILKDKIMSKQDDKKHILDLVKEYAKKYHQDEEYQEGDYIPYAKRVYDEEELVNVVDASLDFWLTAGDYTKEFEEEFGKFLDVQYVSLVNSCSSANYLALASLMAPELKERRIQKGDEIISVACGFPTTIAPILQLGLVPVFLDIDIPSYNIDVQDLEKAISDKTKAIFLAHTMGNPFDIERIKNICEKYHLWLIEDNCDALGSKYNLNGKVQYTGSFGDIGTSSFYPPHHITMGEGGAVYTNNPLLHKIIRSLRDWGRDCVCPPGKDNLCGKRFTSQYGKLPEGYDHKYVYSHFGYNLKATDLQASIGCAQLKKLPSFIEARKNHHQYLFNRFQEEKLDQYFILPEKNKNSDPSWFGFLLSCKEDVDSHKLIQYLEEHHIQTRKLFAGNILKQPCFIDLENQEDAYRIIGDLKNTDYAMEHSFWLGVYPGMNEKMLNYMVETVKDYFNL